MIIDASQLITSEIEIEEYSEDEENKFNLTLQKCEEAENSDEAATPKLFSAAYSSPKRKRVSSPASPTKSPSKKRKKACQSKRDK